jgi:AraC-like DNA-binding protein
MMNEQTIYHRLNEGKSWLIRVEYAVVFQYPFRMAREKQTGEWLGFWWIRQGSAQCRLGNESIRLKRGDAIFFTQELSLSGTHAADDPVDLIAARFSFVNEQGETFRPPADAVPGGYYPYRAERDFEAPVLALLKIWRASGTRDPLYMHALALQIMAMAWSFPQPHSLYGRYRAQMEKAVELIHERFGRQVAMEELAEEVQMHPAYFVKQFKRSIGVAPKKYITEVRIRSAQRLLIESELSVGEIAEQ